jgi:hypothetical protein
MRARNESPRKGISKGISKDISKSVDESSVEAVDGSGEKTLK